MERRRPPVIPPNFFGISFGLAGLAEVWTVASPTLGITDIVGRVLTILAASVWATLVVIYFSKGATRVQEDWRNPILSPFLALVLIVPTLLAGELCAVDLLPGRILVAVLSSCSIVLGGWSTGRWVINDLYDECMHPGYSLPTATGGFVGSIAASEAHLHQAAPAGRACRSRLPAALTPTLAQEAGPPMVAGVAYHALHGGPVDTFAAAPGGYAIFMVVLQLRLAPIYARLRFSPAFWSFTLPTAAIRIGRRRVAPDGAAGWFRGLRASLSGACPCDRHHRGTIRRRDVPPHVLPAGACDDNRVAGYVAVERRLVHRASRRRNSNQRPAGRPSRATRALVN